MKPNEQRAAEIRQAEFERRASHVITAILAILTVVVFSLAQLLD